MHFPPIRIRQAAVHLQNVQPLAGGQTPFSPGWTMHPMKRAVGKALVAWAPDYMLHSG